MNPETNDSLELVKGNFIRDITNIGYLAKSEARRRLDNIIELAVAKARVDVLREVRDDMLDVMKNKKV